MIKRIKQALVATGILGLLAGIAALFGPFISGDAVGGVIQRVRWLFVGGPGSPDDP